MAILGSARSTRRFYAILREQEFKQYKKTVLKLHFHDCIKRVMWKIQILDGQ
ncbi:MAG: hypothetical protein UU58_C0001G0085 [Candidatus Nomurabacteria bacterium GW2011_GWA2_41_25]|uniref:Uncharacterized protein n=1 Tax=Candidatus Nomurabacteria bacterium GW2011_GWA2_41_25 TaxID=1618736 RepID=A0A0G0VWM2_9BACT|nr:MAG: hypothetical protein UU58_C0001G0085 [Candidatus Nomurabacteria bacterium GW2011_GWA2_41_25]